MASNIRIQKICQHCGKEFTAKTTVTKYCGDPCSKKAYKARKREEKIQDANNETKRIKNQSILDIQAKQFLTVRDVATLLNCSVRSVYYQIEKRKNRGHQPGAKVDQGKTIRN
jgi:predicted transcriptional regulator